MHQIKNCQDKNCKKVGKIHAPWDCEPVDDSEGCVHGIPFDEPCKWCCPEDDDGFLD
jgi:hypothetical protein